MLRSHGGLLATIKLLLARTCVHDDTESGDHVNGFAFGSVPEILLAIGSTVAVDMLDFKFSLGSFLVRLCNAMQK